MKNAKNELGKLNEDKKSFSHYNTNNSGE